MNDFSMTGVGLREEDPADNDPTLRHSIEVSAGRGYGLGSEKSPIDIVLSRGIEEAAEDLKRRIHAQYNARRNADRCDRAVEASRAHLEGLLDAIEKRVAAGSE